MRIFQLIEFSTNPSVPNNQTWYRNLYEPLIGMGHDVILVSADAGRKALFEKNEKLRKEFSETLVRKFKEENKKNKFDVCFFYLMEGMFEPWAIEEIRSANIPICNFSCNNIHQFYLVEKVSSLFDLNLYAEKEAGSKFDKINVKSLWWPMASNPKYFHPVECTQDVQTSFVGGFYGSRLENIYQLLVAGLDVHVFGPGWKLSGIRNTPYGYALKNMKDHARTLFSDFKMLAFKKAPADLMTHDVFTNALFNLLYLVNQRFPQNVHPPIDDQGLLELYSRSKITLGFLEVFDKHSYTGRRLKHMHLRDFEAVMSGALYCTDYTEELAEMFEPGKEVITCYDIHDRIDKIKYYLTHENEGNKVRSAGLKRALNDHTYQKRFQTLFSHLGIK